MGKLQVQLEFLDDVVRTLSSLATAHDNHARSIASRARTAQARGGSSWVGDQLTYASSILGDNRQSLQSESADLRDRLVVARSTAEGWEGTQAELRAALAGIMAGPTQAVLGASTSTFPSDQRELAAIDAAYNAAGRKDWWVIYPKAKGGDDKLHPDCVAYINQIMAGADLKSHGQIYDWHNWKNAGYTVVDGWGSTAASGMVLPAGPSAIPQRGSFIELGMQTSDGGDLSDHHAAYYLGQKNGFVYVAESNWGGNAGGVTAYKDGQTPIPVPKASLQKMQWDPDDANANQQLRQHYKGFDTAFFYQPTAASDAPTLTPIPTPQPTFTPVPPAAPQPNLGPTPIAGQSGTLKPR
jgi:hypothetical protein